MSFWNRNRENVEQNGKLENKETNEQDKKLENKEAGEADKEPLTPRQKFAEGLKVDNEESQIEKNALKKQREGSGETSDETNEDENNNKNGGREKIDDREL